MEVWYPLDEGQVSISSGPGGNDLWHGLAIPLDGRSYTCAGKIILPAGQELRANFSVLTDLCFLLDQSSTTCCIGTTWYRMEEPEFFTALGLPREQVFPYHWQPDRPLCSDDRGPYRMDWNYLRRRELAKQIKPNVEKLSPNSSVEDYPVLAYFVCLLIYVPLLRWLTEWPSMVSAACAVILALGTLRFAGWRNNRRVRRRIASDDKAEKNEDH